MPEYRLVPFVAPSKYPFGPEQENQNHDDKCHRKFICGQQEGCGKLLCDTDDQPADQSAIHIANGAQDRSCEQGDEKIPFEVLFKVMFTCSKSDFYKMRLLTIKSGA